MKYFVSIPSLYPPGPSTMPNVALRFRLESTHQVCSSLGSQPHIQLFGPPAHRWQIVGPLSLENHDSDNFSDSRFQWKLPSQGDLMAVERCPQPKVYRDSWSFL
ncbi:uncharacterized protein LOC144323023 [Canis aureus]